MLNSKEHHDLMAAFDRQFKYKRLDREKNKALWASGQLYENGEVNELFKAFRLGYSLGRVVDLENA
jgi:hypothetical protein